MPEQSPAVLAFDDARPAVRSEACARCGAPVETLERYCPACGAQQPIVAELVDADAAVAEQRHFRCNNCGAEVAVDPNQRTYTCAFCDSTYVVDLGTSGAERQTPEFVLPFAVAPEQAHAAFHRGLHENAWFRPGDLRQAKIEEKLRGAYLPFWSFSMLAESQWHGEIGEYWWRTETYTTTENGKRVTKTRRVRETEWWRLNGRHHRYHSAYLKSPGGSRRSGRWSDADFYDRGRPDAVGCGAEPCRRKETAGPSPGRPNHHKDHRDLILLSSCQPLSRVPRMGRNRTASAISRHGPVDSWPRIQVVWPCRLKPGLQQGAACV